MHLKAPRKIPPICWEHKKGDLQIDFDGIPYIWLGKCDYQCHQGKHKNTSIKQKHHLKQQAKLKSDHAASVQMIKLVQPSKKVNAWTHSTKFIMSKK